MWSCGGLVIFLEQNSQNNISNFDQYRQIMQEVITEEQCSKCGKYNTYSLTLHFAFCRDCNRKFMKPDRPHCSRHPTLTMPCYACKWAGIHAAKQKQPFLPGAALDLNNVRIIQRVKIIDDYYQCFSEKGSVGCSHPLDVQCPHSCHKRYTIEQD